MIEPLGLGADDIPDRLRQATYLRIGQEVARFAHVRFAATGQRCDLLDVGGWAGISRRFIEIHEGAEHIHFHGAGAFPNGRRAVYKSRDWTLCDCNLEAGLPCLESDAYDVVICERILSRVHHIEMALGELARVLKPGGLMVLGVPTYSAGLLSVSRYLVSIANRMRTRSTGRRVNRDQVQRFSARSLTKMIRHTTDLCNIRSKRFRSAPFRCTEIQITATKKTASGSRRRPESDRLPFSAIREDRVANRAA